MLSYRVTIYIPKEKRVCLAKLAAKGMLGIFLSLADVSKIPPRFYNFYMFLFVDKKVLYMPYVTFYKDFGNVISWQRDFNKENLEVVRLLPSYA